MQKNNSFRIILDTNIWISLIISNNLSKIDDHLLKKITTIFF
jgi:predicted nucleic acid-binding protein